MARVSVISTVYNGEAYFDRSVPGILAQSLADFEWVIVDDGSTDSTPRLLAELARRDSRVRLLSPGRVGRVAALNLAAEEARGEYLANQDFDDRSYPDRLKLQAAFLEAHSDVAVVGAHYVLIDEIRGERYERLPPADHVDILRALASRIPFAHTLVMFRKPAWREVGGYPGVDNLEDYLLWIAIAARGWRLANLPVVLGEHFVHHNSFFSPYRSAVQLKMAGVQVRAIREFGLPARMYVYPLGRVFYGVLPRDLRRFGRRMLTGSKELDVRVEGPGEPPGRTRNAPVDARAARPSLEAARAPTVKIVHLITSMLSAGGAQAMLQKLLGSSDPKAFHARVISLAEMGPDERPIRTGGAKVIPVETLGMRPGVANPVAVLRLAARLRGDPPDLLQTWQYHADLLGGIAARLAGGIPVVWNIRHGDPSVPGHKRMTVWTARACARLSWRLPARIICCSHSSRSAHLRFGYASDPMIVIPNGFDLTRWKPDPVARVEIRRELDLPPAAPLVGLVARFDPIKDHRTFVLAAARLARLLPEVHFLLCGGGVDWENADLSGWIRSAGVADRFRLLGERDDVPRVTAALDVASLCSYAEGFPNVIGEAMACGVPCVTTNVGDAAWIVGDTGRVVPPRQPEALAEAWRELIDAGPEARHALGAAARQRIADQFDMAGIAARYEGLYLEIAGRARTGSA